MPSVRFSAPATQDVSEGAGFIEHQVVLSGPSDQVVTVTIQGASYRAGDMQTAAQVVTFQPGQTVATFRAAVFEDSVYEGNEVFSFTITSATNATIDQGSNGAISNHEFLGYIIDNDAPVGPTVRFAAPATQDVSEGAGFIEHQVLLSAPSSQVVTVTIQGASYRDGDMQVASQVVTFQPGRPPRPSARPCSRTAPTKAMRCSPSRSPRRPTPPSTWGRTGPSATTSSSATSSTTTRPPGRRCGSAVRRPRMCRRGPGSSSTRCCCRRPRPRS
jgi:hypothetical protein